MIDSPLLLLKLVGLWLLLTTVASLIAAAAYPLYRRQLTSVSPPRRSWLRLVYGLMPVVASSLVVLLMAHPALAGLLVPEHCHGAACGAHTPVLGSGTMASIGFAAFGALGGFVVLGLLAWFLRRAAARLRTLERLTRLTSRAGNHRVLESEGLIACCIGLLQPQVLVSRGLLNALDETELRAVLAHERAHAERRDNLRGFLLHTATQGWPRARRRQLREDLSSDAEQACDAQAVAVVGGPQPVIDAIMRLNELGHRGALRRGVAFGEGDAAVRLERLTGCALPSQGGFQAVASLGLFWLLLATVLTALSHGFLERLTAFGL
ncbi:MAG: M56 family metallopeptidase [Pseudomonadota bacterium]